MLFEIRETETFTSWRESLKDPRAKDKVRSRIVRASFGNFGDWKTESGEVRAMRINYGPGYRLYYVLRENKIVFLLCEGDKRNQEADIKKAIDIAKGI